MGVPLWRAWEICRVLDEADATFDWPNEIGRAIVLTDPEPAPIISRPAFRAPAARAVPPPPAPAPVPRAAKPPKPAKLPPPRAVPPPRPTPTGRRPTLADRDPEAAARTAARRRQRLDRGA